MDHNSVMHTFWQNLQSFSPDLKGNQFISTPQAFETNIDGLHYWSTLMNKTTNNLFMASKSAQKYELQNPVFPQEFRYILSHSD